MGVNEVWDGIMGGVGDNNGMEGYGGEGGGKVGVWEIMRYGMG